MGNIENCNERSGKGNIKKMRHIYIYEYLRIEYIYEFMCMFEGERVDQFQC